MNRTLSEAASVLGIKPSALRSQLRELGVLLKDGTLAAPHIGAGHLFMDPRSRWNPTLGTYSHYAVVMVTEPGMAYLAKRLGIAITCTKDRAA